MNRSRWINPVLEKEFRLRMRTFRSPLSLMIYLLVIGLLAIGFMMTMISSFQGTPDPDASQGLFYFLSGLQLVLITFVTPGLTAGAISGEREKQTLNMLLTTQQSSTAIIFSKLFSSISFMLLIVFATIPMYSIVFLYGGISPVELVSVFLLYIFVMLVLGSFGILFSTLFKRTVISMITTYGVALFMYAFTALASLFLFEILSSRSNVPFFVFSLNPMVALLHIFDAEISNGFFGNRTGLKFWHIFYPVYTVLAAIALLLSIRYLRPVMKKLK